MSKIQQDVTKAIETLKEDGVINVKQRKNYKFANSKKEARALFEEIVKQVDKTATPFVWLPEYENILDWMCGSEKGMLLGGGPGLLKTVIATRVIPTLFQMKYNLMVSPIHARDIEATTGRFRRESWDVIHSSPVVVIDEVGDELLKGNYGDKYYPFKDVVDVCESKNKMLIVTTNLADDDFLQRYKERTMDRLDFLVNAFWIDHESLRQ